MSSRSFDVFDEFAGPIESGVQSVRSDRSVLGDISNRSKSNHIGLKGESEDKLTQLKPTSLKSTQKFTLQSLLPRQPIEPRVTSQQKPLIKPTLTQASVPQISAPENGAIATSNHAPAFATLSLNQIMASKQVAAKYIQGQTHIQFCIMID